MSGSVKAYCARVTRSVATISRSPSTRESATSRSAATWTSTVLGSTAGSLTTGITSGLSSIPRASSGTTFTPSSVMTYARVASLEKTTSRGCAPTVIA